MDNDWCIVVLTYTVYIAIKTDNFESHLPHPATSSYLVTVVTVTDVTVMVVTVIDVTVVVVGVRVVVVTDFVVISNPSLHLQGLHLFYKIRTQGSLVRFPQKVESFPRN